MHNFASAIDATLGPCIKIKRLGHCTARHTTIGKIKTSARHIEECEIIIILTGHQHRWHHAVRAAGQTGRERCAAIAVGGRFAQHFIVACKQRQLNAFKRFCTFQ